MPEVKYVGHVELFEVRRFQEIRNSSERPIWICEPEPKSEINPGAEGIIFSYEKQDSHSDTEPNFGHIVEFMDY